MQDISNNMADIYDTTTNNAGLTALFIGIIIFSLILTIIMIISYWKIFKKKGKPGWAILVPIYNVIVQIQVANLSMIYFLLLLIPIANIYAIIKINISLAKSFNKSTGFAIGLMLLPIIFVPLLAFSEEEDKKQPEISNNFNAMNIINENNITDTNTVDSNILNNSIPTIENVEIENNNIPIVENGDTTTVEAENSNDEIPVINNESVEEPVVVEPTINEINEVENNIPTEQNTNIGNVQVDNNINETENNIPLEISNKENINLETDLSKENDVSIENNINNNETINAFNMAINDNINSQPTIEKVEEEKTLPEENKEPEIINAFNSKPTIVSDNNDNHIETGDVNNNKTNINEPIETIELNNNDNQTETLEKTLSDNKKYCKTCGNEMPSIVSICPKCGTDNE